MAKFESEFDIGEHVWAVVFDLRTRKYRVEPVFVCAVEFVGETRTAVYSVDSLETDDCWRISTQDTFDRVCKTEEEAKEHCDYLNVC